MAAEHGGVIPPTRKWPELDYTGSGSSGYLNNTEHTTNKSQSNSTRNILQNKMEVAWIRERAGEGLEKPGVN